MSFALISATFASSAVIGGVGAFLLVDRILKKKSLFQGQGLLGVGFFSAGSLLTASGDIHGFTFDVKFSKAAYFFCSGILLVNGYAELASFVALPPSIAIFSYLTYIIRNEFRGKSILEIFADKPLMGLTFFGSSIPVLSHAANIASLLWKARA